MYKVLIVDDETTVREGLKVVIPWEAYGFQVVALAQDGQSALNMCRDEEYHLIISDIRMVGMDGLQLIENIREFNKRIQCLILTGYADFNYAKKAIQHNVAGYLLKPIDEEDLIDALVEIKKELDKENTVQELTLIEKERKRERFILSNVLNSTYDKMTAERKRLAKEFEMVWDKYQVLLIQIEEKRLEIFQVLTIKEQIKDLVIHDKEASIFLHETYLGIIINCNIYKRSVIENLYKKISDIMKRSDISYTVALGTCVDSLCEIKDSYHTALTLIEKKFFFPQDRMLIKGQELIKRQNERASTQLTDIIDRVYMAIEVGELELVEPALSEIFHLIDHPYSEEHIKKNYVYVLTIVMNKLQKEKPDKEMFISNTSEKILEIYQLGNYQKLQCFVNLIMDEIDREFKYDQADDQLKKLLVLIDNNYHENLKLEKLARLFNYNSAYLGKLFKSHTGEYFNTYLDKVRIKNAKRLLLEGLKVYRVAELVGYNNVDYFHSKFKKYVGLSPSTYRRKEKNNV
ncbi:AraC family transcriptional regulator [Alkalihalobacillus alcalophilus ATCC 27647 = CGMCC 1.3604]|uniref:AraC family transcriptional regulator n=1 Tax=Alkalihalobacillus alcalophilus ATCC 27647 = CGMCC 1.3604 TaxID=1218173 RepID=A0A094XJL2_ALKAL|nr:response regulator transcription factor [Alkalihalobacillus alcalophilus]KGA98960.1 AraC family transcriptional regulator [Alkalihalobacillus alcalophilus ATCC 27647 = CGMCC 1.3604]MED1561997.1 response regulator transcription factor [Alkalihalobacillus alcalophilus]THG89145.1 AraC family transcriptional regulator [Alkalihalobacillus alcalophilus ATCC 27647 = CGMCC 1.3604]